MDNKPKDVYVVLQQYACIDDNYPEPRVKGVFYNYLDAVFCIQKYCNAEMDRYQVEKREIVNFWRASKELACGTRVATEMWYSKYDMLWIVQSTVE